MPIMLRIPVALSPLWPKENGCFNCERRTNVLIYSIAQRVMHSYCKTLSFTVSLSVNSWLSHSCRKPQPILLAAEGNLPRRAGSSRGPLGAAALCWFPAWLSALKGNQKSLLCQTHSLGLSLLWPKGCRAARMVFPQPVWSTNSLFSFPSLVAAPLPGSPQPGALAACEALSPLQTQHLLLSLKPACLCLL